MNKKPTLWLAALSAAFLLVLTHAHLTFAQSATVLTQGQSFANSLKPTATGQIVNQAGVNSTAWGTNTSTPSATPSGLGKFSTPVDGTSVYTQAKTLGLTSLGNQAQADCASYVKGSGDLYRDQECAAVNFMTNKCVYASTNQSQILSNAGYTYTNASDCSGTYGLSVKTQGYADTLSSSDSIFSGMSGLSANIKAAQGAGAAGVTCSASTSNSPGATQTYDCTSDVVSDLQTCSRTLSVTTVSSTTPATQSPYCNEGTLVDGYCVSTSQIDATPIYTCPNGEALINGKYCVSESMIPGTPVYVCQAGYTLQDQTCTQITYESPTTEVPACPANTTAETVGFWYKDSSGVDYGNGMPVLDGINPSRNPDGSPLISNMFNDMWPRFGISANTYGVSESSPYYVPGTTHPLTPHTVCKTGTLNMTLSDYQSTYLSGSEAAIFSDLTKVAFSGFGSIKWDGAVSYSTYYSRILWFRDIAYFFDNPGTQKCPEGAALQNGMCVTTITTSATVGSYTCSDGYSWDSQQQMCVKTTTTDADLSGYSCPADYTQQGAYCVKTTQTDPGTNYSCPDGSLPANGVCTVNSAQPVWVDGCSNFETSAGKALVVSN